MQTSIRPLLLSALLCLAIPALGQRPPPKLEPLPEPPPAPAQQLDEQALNERGVKIRPGERAEEFLVDGKRVIRVRQSNGKTYYLIEHQPGLHGPAGTDDTDSRIRAPQWLLHEW